MSNCNFCFEAEGVKNKDYLRAGTQAFLMLPYTGATPKTMAAPVTKNISPTYSPEIPGWDFSWLE
jgi:hypothetical protein